MFIKKNTLSIIISFLFIFFLTISLIYINKAINDPKKFQKKKSEASEIITRTVNPEVLITDLKNFFEKYTNNLYPTDPKYFGVYVIQPVNQKIYLGISAGLPAEKDGALLASYDGQVINPIYDHEGKNLLSEQGILDIDLQNNILYLPGLDPLEDWSYGNLYTFNTVSGEFIKYRNLENTIHGLGSLIEEGKIFIGTGSHRGDNQTFEGRLYISEDGAKTWRFEIFSNYRLWDLIRQNEFIIGVGLENINGVNKVLVKKTNNEGRAWEKINNLEPYYRTRLLKFQNLIVTKTNSSQSDSFWIYDGEKELLKKLPFGFYLWSDYVFNAMTIDKRSFLYFIASQSTTGGTWSSNNKYLILRTKDLNSFEILSYLEKEPSSISYWPDFDQILISNIGIDAKVLKIQLTDGLSLPLAQPIPTFTPSPIPPTPTPTWYPPAPITPIISKEGKLLLSSFGRINIVNSDGTNFQNFINGSQIPPYSPQDASWAIDGSEVVFIARRYDFTNYQNYYKIMSKKYPTGEFYEWLPEQKARITISNPHFTPDKKYVYFSMSLPIDSYGNSRKGIYRVSLARKTPENIIPHPEKGDYLLRDISSNGRKIMYYYTGNGLSNQNDDIFIANSDGSNPIDITNTPSIQELGAVFSPIGTEIIFYKFNPSTSTYDLYKMKFDGSDIKSLIVSTGLDENNPCYSPNGKEIVYGFQSKTNTSVTGVNKAKADGSTIRKILDLSNNMWLNMHCWAPDPLYLPKTK